MLRGTSKQIEALCIYYIYSPIQLDNKQQDLIKDESRFEILVQQADFVLSMHPNLPGIYRVIPISKTGRNVAVKYYSRRGKSCYSSPKAKRWFQQVSECQEIWERESLHMDRETFWKTYPGATLAM